MQSLRIIVLALIFSIPVGAANAQLDASGADASTGVSGIICVDPVSGGQRLLPAGESLAPVCAQGENSFVAISVEHLAAPPPQIQPFNRDITALPDEAADDGIAVP